MLNPFDGTYSTGFDLHTATLTFSRPANTTAYAAKDVVSDSTTAPSVASFKLANLANRGGYLTKVRMLTNQSTFTGRLRLHFYNAAPTIANDNDAYALLWADRTRRIGSIDLPPASTEGTGSDASTALNDTCRLAFAVDAGSFEKGLWVVVEALDAFTPASGQSFFFVVQADSN